MPKYKTIKGLSQHIAKFAVQHIAYETENRWIWRDSDFTFADWMEVQRIAANVADVLESADGRKWWGTSIDDTDNVLHDLKKVCGGLMIGFKAQDEIIETCALCGVRILQKRGGEV